MGRGPILERSRSSFHYQTIVRQSYSVLSTISNGYPQLKGRSPTRYSPVRHSRGIATLAVRLACLRRAASVRSEPGSNSPWYILKCIAASDIISSLTPLISLKEFVIANLSISFHGLFRSLASIVVSLSGHSNRGVFVRKLLVKPVRVLPTSPFDSSVTVLQQFPTLQTASFFPFPLVSKTIPNRSRFPAYGLFQLSLFAFA